MQTITEIHPSLVAIGEALREARERAGFTQTSLADELERKQATISQWEAGKRCPALRDLPQIAAALKIPPWSLAKKIFEKIRNSG